MGEADAVQRWCYDCGAPCTTNADGVPICATHGERWKVIRSAPCADVLITRNDEALLVRRANHPYRGRWELPGGFSDRGEHPAATARREIAEELGVEVRLTGLLGVYFDPYLDDVAYVLTFLGEITDEPRPDPDEVTEVAWFPAGELPPTAELVPGHADRVHDWQAGRTNILGPTERDA
jgi:8-oxo-dGTP diphosphatase